MKYYLLTIGFFFQNSAYHFSPQPPIHYFLGCFLSSTFNLPNKICILLIINSFPKYPQSFIYHLFYYILALLDRQQNLNSANINNRLLGHFVMFINQKYLHCGSLGFKWQSGTKGKGLGESTEEGQENHLFLGFWSVLSVNGKKKKMTGSGNKRRRKNLQMRTESCIDTSVGLHPDSSQMVSGHPIGEQPLCMVQPHLLALMFAVYHHSFPLSDVCCMLAT